jgi:Ca2+-binding RTX toxin-like protein
LVRLSDGDDTVFVAEMESYDSYYKIAGGRGSDTIDFINMTTAVTFALDRAGQFQNFALAEGAPEDTGLGWIAETGVDRLLGSAFADILTGDDLDNILDGRAGEDYIQGQSGNDTISGGSGGDLLQGGVGHDVIMGGADHDQLLGETGNDRLLGQQGNDTLVGGSGNDELFGGVGADVFKGGTGRDDMKAGNDVHRDIFIFSTITESGRTNATRDIISNFDSGEDVIKLKNIDANINVTGNQAFSFSEGPAAYSVWLKEKSGDKVQVLADNNGDGISDFELIVVGSASLTESDFIL